MLSQDPRRLDPRRIATSVGVPSVPNVDDAAAAPPEFDASVSLTKPLSLPVVASVENPVAPLILNSKSDDKSLENPFVSETDQVSLKEELSSRPEEIVPTLEVNASSDHARSPPQTSHEDSIASKLSDAEVTYGADTSSVMESDWHSPTISNTSLPEETSQELPQLPPYVELTEEQQRTVRKLAVERIIESYKHPPGTDCCQTCMALLARLVAQVGAT